MDSNGCTQLTLDLFDLAPSAAPSVVDLSVEAPSRAGVAAGFDEGFPEDRFLALGALADGLARAAVDPLTCVLANLRFVCEELGPHLEATRGGARPGEAARGELEAALTEARVEAERLASLVRELRDFATPWQSAEVDERCSLDEVLTDALSLAAGRLRATARLERSAEFLPPVRGGRGRVGRALTLLVGALLRRVGPGDVATHCLRIDARPAGGSLHLRLSLAPEAAASASGSVPSRGAEEALGVQASWLEPRRGAGASAVVRWIDGATAGPNAAGSLVGPAARTDVSSEGARAVELARALLAPVGGHVAWTPLSGGGAAAALRLTLAGVRPLAPRVARRSSGAGAASRVLLVDADPAVATALRRELGGWAVVESATSAREALAALAAGRRFDALLCELVLPDMPASRLHEVVREHWAEQAERMLFATAGALGDDARAFLNRVPRARIDKPFEREALLAALERLTAGDGRDALDEPTAAPRPAAHG